MALPVATSETANIVVLMFVFSSTDQSDSFLNMLLYLGELGFQAAFTLVVSISVFFMNENHMLLVAEEKFIYLSKNCHVPNKG